MRTIAKAIVSAIAVTAALAVNALADDVLNADETSALIASAVAGLLGVIAVWAVPNRPEGTNRQ